MSIGHSSDEMIPFILSFVLTKVIPIILLLLTILVLAVTTYAWHNWKKNFGGEQPRLSRRQRYSPSNAQPPRIVSYEENQRQILMAVEKYTHLLQKDNNDDQLLLKQLKSRTTPRAAKDAASRVSRKKAARIHTMTPSTVAKMKAELNNTNHHHSDGSGGGATRSRKTITSSEGMMVNVGSLSADNAPGLDMDHVYLSFGQLLWGYLFVGINSEFSMRKGTFILKWRTWLNQVGVIKPKPVDYDTFAAKMILETSMACYYKCKLENNIAGFFIPNMPYVDGNGQFKICDLMAVYIDLVTKKMTKATFEGREISSRNAAGILFFHNSSANHAKIHSLANWGLNSEECVKEVNPFLYQNSIITVLYNHFGYSGFKGYIPQWIKQGFLDEKWTGEAALATLRQGMEDNIFAHPNIEELVPYSNLVNFIVKSRPVFLSDFAKYREQFPGVHGEAFFVGTVIHSLDHTSQDWACEDPLWLDVDDEQFGLMSQMGRVVKAGFNSDLPGLYFHKRFKGAKHPFYSGFYAKAAKIDKKLADEMDTCIVK